MNKYETGQYGAKIAKLEFECYGFRVCTSKLNDKGLGFRVKKMA